MNSWVLFLALSARHLSPRNESSEQAAKDSPPSRRFHVEGGSEFDPRNRYNPVLGGEQTQRRHGAPSLLPELDGLINGDGTSYRSFVRPI